MGGPAQREPGDEPERLTLDIKRREDQLRTVLSGVPVATSPASVRLGGPVEGAERKVRELMEHAKQIDAMFGRSARGETQDLQKEVARLRMQLEVIGGEQVAGVNRRYEAQVQRIGTGLDAAEHGLRIGALPEAKAAFASASAGLESLSEAIAATRKLFAAGAPPELVAAPDKALELAQAGDGARAQLMLRAVGVFLDNTEAFSGDAGRPGAAGLAAFVQAVQAQDADLAKAGQAIDAFAKDITYPPEQRAADRDAIAKGAQALGAASAETVLLRLDGWLAQGEMERAKALAGMALTYVQFAERGVAGLEGMKAAMARYADTGAQDAAEQFGEVAARTAFAADSGRVKAAVGAWEQGAQKNVAQKALGRVDELLGQKKYAEAGTLLTYTAMYADSVATLGLSKAKPAAQFSQDTLAGVAGMARALNAIGRGETAMEGKDAGKMFTENYASALHGGQVMALQRSHSALRQRFEGRAPWAKGMEADTIPKLREYERTAADPALKGQTLDQLFTACGRAAQSGDQDAYVRSVRAFGDRLGKVYARHGASQMADAVDEMDKAIHSIFQSYAGTGPVPPDAAARLRKLREGMKDFSASLRSGAAMDETIPQLRFNALAAAFQREQAQAAITAQERRNGDYAKMAQGITGSIAGIALRDSTAELQKASGALLNGDQKGAREAYASAMDLRQSALAAFSAGGKAKKPGAGGAVAMFDRWHDAHMAVFDGIFAGKDTGREQEQVTLVERAVFELPENARGIIDFSTMQRNVREFALAGDMNAAKAELDRMQKTLERQKFWTNVATTVAGVGIGFVPGGQILSGAIFASMATTVAVEEVAATGRVSGMTWLNLGVTLGTWGVGGIISGLRSAAMASRAAGAGGRAAAYGLGATALTTATLGTGVLMTGMMVPATMDAYRQGRFGEVAFNIAMAVFPFAHMGVSYVSAKRVAASGRAVQSFDEMVADIRAARVAERTQAQAAPTTRRMPVVAQDEIANQSAYDRFRDTGMLPEKIPARMQGYLQERFRGATHQEAMDALEGRVKAPTEADRLRQQRESLQRRKAVEETDLGAPARSTVDAAVWERGRGRKWMEGGEELGGEAASTGRILRGIEKQVATLVKGGQDLDVIVVSGDKAKLNQINQLVGRGYGNYALEAYREVFRRSVYRATGKDGMGFVIRPSQSGDEAIGVIVVRGGMGAEVHARLMKAIKKDTQQVFREVMSKRSGQSLAPVKGLMRRPLDLVAETVDVSEPVSVRRGADGGVTAANRNGSDAMVTHDVEVAPGRSEKTTEFMPKLVRTTDEQGSASHAPAMREKLNSGTETEIRKAPNINDVELGPQVRVSGVAFEIRLEITDPAVLAEAHSLLPRTRKGLYEVLTNGFGIRGFNTFLGHYGANRVVNVVEEAVGSYAARAGVRVRRLGTMKYIMEGGTPAQLAEMNRSVNAALEKAGMKFRTSKEAHVSKTYFENVTPGEALATVSNGRLKVLWGEFAYEDANAAISAMAIANDRTLARLFGARYGNLRQTIDFVRKNPAIRNVEDLLVALDHSEVAGPNGSPMKAEFLAFVARESDAFRGRLDNLLAVPVAEAEAIPLRKAVGAEDEVLQAPARRKGGGSKEPAGKTIPFRQKAADAETLERTIGAKPRGAAVEAGMALLRTAEEKAIARVLDAAMAGEIEGPLPPEYRKVIDGLFREGESAGMGGVAAEERVLLIAASVQDVIFNKSVGALERALAAAKAGPETVQDAMMFLKTRRNMELAPEDVGRMTLDHFDAVERRMRGGMGEAEAIVSVVKENNVVYSKALAELEAGLKGRPPADAERARQFLKFLYGRRMSKAETDALGQQDLDAINARAAGGEPIARAIAETIAPPELAPKTAATLVGMFGKGSIGEGYFGYFRKNGLTEEFAALAAKRAGGGDLAAPGVRNLFFELFGLAPADLQAYFRMAARGGRAPVLDVESLGKAPEARAFRAGSGEPPTVDLLSADGARMFSYAKSYLKFAEKVAADIERAHAASNKPVVLIVPLGGGYVPARTLQMYLSEQRKSGIISELALIGSPSDATKGADYGGLIQRLRAKYGEGGATCVVIEEVSSGNSIRKAEKLAERVRNEAGKGFDFLIYGAMGQNDLMKCLVSDNALVSAANEGVLTFENPMLQQNAAAASRPGGMPLSAFATPRTRRAAMDVDYGRLAYAEGMFNFSTRNKGPAGTDQSAGNLFSGLGTTHAEIVAELRRLLSPKNGITVRMSLVSNLFSMDNPYMSYAKHEAPDGRIVFDAASFRLGRVKAFPMQQALYSFFQGILRAKKE